MVYVCVCVCVCAHVHVHARMHLIRKVPNREGRMNFGSKVFGNQEVSGGSTLALVLHVALRSPVCIREL